METYTLIGTPLRAKPIEVSIRRSNRAKRLSLRICRLQGAVTLSCPKTASRGQLEQFIHSQERWLFKTLSALSTPQRLDHQAYIPFEGAQKRIHICDASSVTIQDDTIYVSSAAPLLPQLCAYFKTKAQQALTSASDHFAQAAGTPYSSLVLRDTKTRWGSCSSAGRLMYSWRLIMAPPRVLSYVAAHEVAHLSEMNHSSAFWKCVEALDPDYASSRQWLRKNGHHLLQVPLKASPKAP